MQKYPEKKKKYLLVLSGLLLLITAGIVLSVYFSRINIYGKFRVYVTQNLKSISENTECSGISVFKREAQLEKHPGFFKSCDYWYFNNLVIRFNDVDTALPVKIRIVNQNEDVLLDTTVLNKREINVYNLNYKYGLCEKLSALRLFLSFKLKILVFKLRILIFCLFLAIMLSFLVALGKYSNKTYLKITMPFSVLFLSILFFHVFVSGKLFLWSGVCLLAFLFTVIVLILSRLIKTDVKMKENIMTVIISVFAGLLLAEILLRITGINVSAFEKRFGYYESVQYQNRIEAYHLRPENTAYLLSNSEFEYERVSNSMGLSGEEINQDKKENEYLIIALGDSFTEGDGAHSDSTWLKFLERKIPDNDSVDFRFINAGVCGSDPVYEYRLLKDKLLDYKPDLVIVSYGYEMTDMITRGGEERFEKMKPAIEKHWWHAFYSVSFVCRLLVHNLCGYNDLLLTDAEYNTATEKAISDLKKSLVQFRELAKNNDFELLIVFYPQRVEVDEGKLSFNSELVKFANEEEINNLNLLEYYRTVENITGDNSQEYYWKYDGHHNAAGYEKFANGVLWKLRQTDSTKF